MEAKFSFSKDQNIFENIISCGMLGVSLDGERVLFASEGIKTLSGFTQEEIKKMIAYCKERDIEIIPEVPCLSHSDYLLQAHPEFAENTEDVLPDAYCPQNPGIYQLLFELLDEIIALFGPKTIHIGHDELYTIGLCEKCRGKDPVELFSEDIKKIYRYLKDRGIQTMLWSDKLLNAHSKRGKDAPFIVKRQGDFCIMYRSFIPLSTKYPRT